MECDYVLMSCEGSVGVRMGMMGWMFGGCVPGKSGFVNQTLQQTAHCHHNRTWTPSLDPRMSRFSKDPKSISGAKAVGQSALGSGH